MPDLIAYLDPPPLREELVLEHHQADDYVARELHRLQSCFDQSSSLSLNNEGRLKAFLECRRGKATILPAPRKRIDPSIYELPPEIIEEAKKAKDPEGQIELACLDLRTRILLATDIRISHTRLFIECVQRNKGQVKPPDR